MSNYFKKLLFSLLILAIPYMNSAVRAMDEENDHTSILTHQNLLAEVREESFAQNSSIFNRVDEEKIPDLSFTTHLKSEFRNTARTAYELMGYALTHPKQTMFIGGLMLLDVAAANCTCLCSNSGVPKFYGDCSRDLADCTSFCNHLGFPVDKCIVGDPRCPRFFSNNTLI